MNEQLPPEIEAIRDRIPEAWGKWIDAGPGWFPLLAGLDRELARIAPDYEVHQCKAKFGSLRFYASAEFTSDDDAERFHGLIRTAETASAGICEECGEEGRLVDVKGWMWALCERHEEAKRKGGHR
ncbi:hypothetical protein E4U02_07495 [Microbacterium paludicola]|jgi:hypothetical protein|uniref:Uncharacterized protein n=1 Tax=Microbacterium paludicola TaxID=300019 RepID=A0A4Y9FXP7_9MICO|nr:hypothetical protein [Microbacterium paludicola]MBF0816249.1 hypothetical protein [Microbacterium paludicola]TFU33052.1 hypothetical protein E4U02_07495 [Microbacterium paludicola]